MDNIYIYTLLKKKLVLHSRYLNKNFEKNIYNQLINEVGNKCIKEGYVDKNTIKIIKRSKGYTLDSNFSGNTIFDIVYKANICNPVQGNIIKCKIDKINKFGIQSKLGPLEIIIGKQYHTNKELFDNIQIGKTIDITVIGTRYTINNNIIEVVGRFTKDINKKNIAKFDKNIDNSINSDKADDLDLLSDINDYSDNDIDDHDNDHYNDSLDINSDEEQFDETLKDINDDEKDEKDIKDDEEVEDEIEDEVEDELDDEDENEDDIEDDKGNDY